MQKSEVYEALREAGSVTVYVGCEGASQGVLVFRTSVEIDGGMLRIDDVCVDMARVFAMCGDEGVGWGWQEDAPAGVEIDMPKLRLV